MKTFKLLTLFAASALVLSSCSNNEALLQETEPKSLLKSYKVKRDANGAYSIDFDLHENVKTEKVKNHTTNSNDFYLYSSDKNYASRRESEDLVIDGDKLSIGFIDTNTDRKPSIDIYDDNITLAKNNDEEMLKEYSVTSNEDGTYNLDFEVNNKVSVDFVYKEDAEVYEVHLEEGKSSKSKFSRTITKKEGIVLRINFVNHYKSNTSAKGYAARELETTREKPRIIIGDDTDVDNII